MSALKRKKNIQYRKVNIDRKWLILLIVLGILSFFIDLRPIIFLSIFSVANALLLTIDRYLNAPVDVELSTFSAVLLTSVFSLKWGIAAAILTKFAAIIYNKKFTIDHLFMIGGYMVAAVIASMMGNNIVTAGIISTIVTNIYVVFVSRYITHLSNYEIMMYGASNTIFNIVMFIGFANPIEFIMTLF